jgi:hypothetical protein
MVTDRSAEETAARVDAALAGLADLRHQLDAAGRSEIPLSELTNSLRQFGEHHGPVLNQLARAVLETLRVQALEQAYQWREQLK